LVLLDISMPGLSGEETCTRLRATATGQAATIIAYTAHAFPEDRARLLGGGFDEVLVKPINRQQLETMVAEL
ncbi:MAG: response regulator, partial [Azonexus sp.]|nr:response regulator [Azonexus sp.]